MSVGDAVSVSNTVGDTAGSILEAFDSRLLLVRINVELDEQEQVAGQDSTSEQGSSLSPSAVPAAFLLPEPKRKTRPSCESP